jgi:hypothetical protein
MRSSVNVIARGDDKKALVPIPLADPDEVFPRKGVEIDSEITILRIW